MSIGTYLVRPYNFTVTGSQSAASAPASNLNVDYPNMVWRSTGTTGAYVAIALDASLSWDFVGLVGVNLFGADTIRIRAAGSAANVTASPAYDETFKVTGTENEDFNLAYHLPATAMTHRYIRLDFTLSDNPNAFVQVQRLVIGKRLEGEGIDVGADFNFEDTSRITEYRGIQISDPFDAKQSWKFSISNVKATDYNSKWKPFLKASSGKAVLFIPDTFTGAHSQEAVFGRIQGQTNGSLESGDTYKVNLYIREV